MIETRNTGRQLIRFSWAGLVFWQLCWHAILPPPLGSSNWILAIVAAVPLLLLSAGVLKTRHKALVWCTFLTMLYFIIAVMETWSNAEQRIPAVIQVILSCGFFLGLLLFNRRVPPKPE